MFVSMSETARPSLSSFSLASTTDSEFGDGTVAKLDVLLTQIEDIKKSVVEMDADLFCVGKVMNKSQKNFLQLTINADDDSEAQTTDSVAETPGNHSPTLEWDSNDLIGESYFFTPAAHNHRTRFNLDTIEESPSYEQHATSPVNLNKSLTRLSPTGLTLPLKDDSSETSSSSSSGKGSLASSPGVEREKKLRDLVDEARRSGLVHELLDLLLKNAKRDSAYFED